MESNPQSEVITPTHKNNKLELFNAIINVVLLIFFIGILVVFFVKVYPDMESFKAVNKDVCKMCMDKTGGICVDHLPDVPKEYNNVPNINNINWSKAFDN